MWNIVVRGLMAYDVLLEKFGIGILKSYRRGEVQPASRWTLAGAAESPLNPRPTKAETLNPKPS